tara:strand:- start:27 stop:155 length:129 start_codon:yes stop_codon:yes gene_type:complete
MKKIFIVLLFASGLILSGCSKSSPKPTCQEGGELQITQEENN